MSQDDESKRFYGIYRGRVSSVADPKRVGRLLVQVPTVNGTGDLGWALPCFPYLTQQPVLDATVSGGGHSHTAAGKTRKITLRLPRRGDPVWVMFEGGQPDKPVWLGSWTGV